MSMYKKSIVSDYIENPLLISGRKSHLRLYLLVNYKPFIVEISKFGKLFLAKNKYKNNDFTNKDIHDTHRESTGKNMYYPDKFPNKDQIPYIEKQILE